MDTVQDTCPLVNIGNTSPDGDIGTVAGLFASDMGKAFFSEADAGGLQQLRAALLNSNKHLAEQMNECLASSQVRRYIPDPVQLATNVS